MKTRLYISFAILSSLFLFFYQQTHVVFGGQNLITETEANDTAATANPLAGNDVVVTGSISPNSDLDFFSFTANVNDRVYAATQTGFSADDRDTVIEIMNTDGTTVLEKDDDAGSLSGQSSSVAGRILPAAGTYFVRVRGFSSGDQIRPYQLHFRLQSGAPTAETEPNGATANANPLPASGWITGTITSGDTDVYSLSLNAGDTVFASLDLDPERNGSWNGQLGLGLFNNQFLTVNDSSPSDSDTSPPAANSETLFMTVKDAGAYFVQVNAGAGGATGTYHLSVSVHPAQVLAACTTYSSADLPKTIGPNASTATSTLVILGNPRIGDLDVNLALTHADMADLDVVLTSPRGNSSGLFTDVGSSSITAMNLALDDEAGAPIDLFNQMAGMIYQPERDYRLAWFDGQDAGGTWTLAVTDDGTGDGGILTGWSVTICEAPPPPSCPVGTVQTTVFSMDFEANNGGFTSSGTQNEWQHGTPSFAPITTCNSGVNCWTTDLDNTYNSNSNQNLLSPNINLAGYVGPVQATWAQKYQLENAAADQALVEARQVGGATPRKVWEWLDGTMTTSVGATTLNESAGWGLLSADLSSYAGQNIELRFNLTSNGSTTLAGLAVDDVTVTACRPTTDLAMSKIVTPAGPVVPGQPVTYTLAFANNGLSPATGVVITDVAPLTLTNPSFSSSGPVITPTGSVNFAWQVADLAPGASGLITITGVVSPDLSSDTSFTNTATITSTTVDTDTTNNSSQAPLAVTIPQVAFSSATYSLAENAGQAPVAVTITPAPQITVTVTYSTTAGGSATPGSDYAATGGVLTFSPGVTNLTFNVPLTDDLVDELDETVNLALSNPNNAILAAPANASLTIFDDDTAELSLNDLSVLEGNSGTISAVFTLTLSTASDRTINVTYTVIDGTATAPADYTAIPPTLLTFNPGVTQQIITVTVKGDVLDEDNETFLVNLSDPVNVTLTDSQGVGTIIDDDGAEVIITETGDSTQVAEGGVTDAYRAVLGSQPANPVTITVTTDGQISATPALLTFSPANWSIPQTVTVAAVDDTVGEASPHLSVITHTASSLDASYAGLAIISVTVAITDNDTATAPGQKIYLPLVLNNYDPPLPDLVVTSFTASSSGVQVVIKNQGSVPVVDEFWVDFYVAPNPAPTGVNQIWNDGRSTYGLVWGVTQAALPLPPNGTLTLAYSTVPGAPNLYYFDSLSNFPDVLAAGTPVSVQVDSANAGVNYGAVLESDEEGNGVYNNIMHSTATATALSQVELAGSPGPGPAPSAGNLPPRP